MCIFSGPVDSVSKTRIFGRLTEEGVQYLVYQMEFSSDKEVAMILPFPNAQDTPDANPAGWEPEFISLEKCPKFFDLIDKAFPKPVYRGGGTSRGMKSFSFGATLEVHNVGAFEASFVPTIRDFDRLDPRFRFADGTLEAMQQLYADFSFAVFKLKPGQGQKVHPMAFRFNTARPDSIFFPTVHVHDGRVHPTEDFDHSIYAQVPAAKTQAEIELARRNRSSQPSEGKLTDYLSQEESCGILSDDFGFKAEVKGRLKNQDLTFSV